MQWIQLGLVQDTNEPYKPLGLYINSSSVTAIMILCWQLIVSIDFYFVIAVGHVVVTDLLFGMFFAVLLWFTLNESSSHSSNLWVNSLTSYRNKPSFQKCYRRLVYCKLQPTETTWQTVTHPEWNSTISYSATFSSNNCYNSNKTPNDNFYNAKINYNVNQYTRAVLSSNCITINYAL